MTMPRRLIMVRHGLSEANVNQRSLINLPKDLRRALAERPDWEHRLTAIGVEQAKIAGDWIRQNIGPIASFDVVYYSPFIRTNETAIAIAGDEDVLLTAEDRIIERDWGLFGKVSKEEQKVHFPRTVAEKKANPLYARFDGGESIMDVYGRIRDMDATLHREYPEGTVLMVTHGDYMNARRYTIERMFPEEWMALDGDQSFSFHNCSLLEYTRVNPDDPEDVRERLQWRRFIHTNEPEQSPYGGQWVELTKPRRLTPAQSMARVERHKRLIPDDIMDSLRKNTGSKNI
ncbi:MAG: histidine phosphatase family protein [Candidatus Saccharimonas sp.]